MQPTHGDHYPSGNRPAAESLPPGPVARKPSLALIIGMAVVGLALGGASGCKAKGDARAASGVDAATTASVAVPARPVLPPEPAPLVADKASEVPDLEAKLAADKAYGTVWSGPRTDVNLFLTAVSELLAVGGVSTAITKPLRDKNLFDAAVKLHMIFARIGKFPDDFTKKLGAHLAAVRGDDHLGTWSPWNGKQDPVHDFTALAAWSRPDDPAYLRERLGTKRFGPFKWSPPVEPTDRPWLVSERAATERLALLGPLKPSDCGPLRQYEERVDAASGSAIGACAPRWSVSEDQDLAPISSGHRVTVTSPDYEMTDDECATIVGRVRRRAGDAGAVYVRIPLVNDRPDDHAGESNGGTLKDNPLCLEINGKGVEPGTARRLQAFVDGRRRAEREKAR